MYKLAGELTPVVIHVAARWLACQALSNFGDHGDVMAVRPTGFCHALRRLGARSAGLCFGFPTPPLSVGRLPVLLHFFDGFRTSHEVAKIQAVGDEVLHALISQEALHAHRARAMRSGSSGAAWYRAKP